VSAAIFLALELIFTSIAVESRHAIALAHAAFSLRLPAAFFACFGLWALLFAHHFRAVLEAEARRAQALSAVANAIATASLRAL
jgi:hypothetical protein